MSTKPGRNVARAKRSFINANGEGPWDCYGCHTDVMQIGRGTWDGNLHHLDEDCTNDAPDNLVMMHAICHQRLHGPPTGDERRRISEKLHGRPSPTKGMKFPHRSKPRIVKKRKPYKHDVVARLKMSQPRRRFTCDDCDQEWSVNWIERHKKTGKCQSRVTHEKLIRYECPDCKKMYPSRWMQRHRNEGRCIAT